MRLKNKRQFFLVVFSALIITGCGFGDDETDTDNQAIEENEIVKEKEEIKEIATEESTEKATDSEENEEKNKEEREKESEKENKTVSPATLYTEVNDTRFAKEAVNVRKGPNTSFEKLGTLSEGQKVSRIGVADNGWSVIEYNGQEAYVSGSYLDKDKPVKTVVEQSESSNNKIPDPKKTSELKETPKPRKPAPKTPAPKETPAPKKPAPKTPEPKEIPEPKTPSLPANKYASEVLHLVNRERKKAGIASLSSDSALNAAASIRAVEAEKNFSHTRPDGRAWSTILQERNITSTYYGENLAMGSMTPEGIVDMWMNSAGHRANILNERFTKIGIGVHEGNSTHWAQLFSN